MVVRTVTKLDSRLPDGTAFFLVLDMRGDKAEPSIAAHNS